MKLLFDQNLSKKLVHKLEKYFPDSNHVLTIGLSAEDDKIVWEYARKHDFVLVTQDADFYEIGLLRGFPPKIIWLRCGNTSTNSIQRLIENNYLLIWNFVNNTNEICLELL